MAFSDGKDFDDVLKDIAKEMRTDAEVDDLGKALGISVADIGGYKVGNKDGRRYDGSLSMLRDWNKTQLPSTVSETLRGALTQVGRIDLCERHFSTHIAAGVRVGAGSEDIKTNVESKKISESLNTFQCREKLEKMYLNKLCKIRMKPWDQNDYAELKDMHTRVTMVKKDAHGRNTVKKEILHGSVTEIFSRKVNDKLPDRILISAAAGRGKTTAVAKMAYDWANKVQGSGLEDLPLLFVLRLRNTDKYTSIGEAIKSQLLSDVDDVTPTGIEDFIRKNQGICHIIFDGLDEYAGITSESNVVKIMRWEEYRDCRVLVTTRPHLENFFNEGDLPLVYTKMEIEGFSTESSRKFIDKFFVLISDVSSGEGLKVYLDSQPLINELVITPLFCLMVCHLWSEGLLTEDISTQTGLFDSVNAFLMHHANARKNRIKITSRRLRTIISKLGKVALAALLSDAKKLVFTQDDFRKVPTILNRACELGIVSKTIVTLKRLPHSHETTSTTIEFYHKLAQEHAAGKRLEEKTKKYLLRRNISKLDRVLNKIKGHIGDYENLLRFAAGADNAICIRIMEAILTNYSLDESERYRILLDCSSETKSSAEGKVSSLIQRCVTSKAIILRSPTVYTVVGLQNLPKQLKRQVDMVNFNGSTVTSNVTKGLWSCLGAFSKLRTLIISDSSLSFPLSPPKLIYVTKLTAERVTSQSYECLLSSLPGLKEIDITIDDAERDISQITAGLQLTREEQLTEIRLRALPSPGKRGRCGSVGLYKYYVNPQGFRLQIKDCLLSAELTDMLWAWFRSLTIPFDHLTILDSSLSFSQSSHELPNVTNLTANGVTSQSYKGLLSSLPGLKAIDITIDDAERDISQITAGLQRTGREQLTEIRLQALPSPRKRRRCGSVYKYYVHQGLRLQIKDCLLSAEITDMLWSWFRSFTIPFNLLTILDSSLSFSQSSHELPYVTNLTANGLTSQSYKGLLSSLPGLKDIDITIDDAERDISQITAGLQLTRREQLTKIRLQALPSPRKGSRRGSIDYCVYYTDNTYTQACQSYMLEINHCLLSAEMTDMLWSCFRSFTTPFNHLTISHSSLTFPSSPPELPNVMTVKANMVTLHNYEGLLSSLPGLKEIDTTIDDAESM